MKMKKHSVIFVVLFFLPMLMWAQHAADILVFSVEGDVTISRNKITIPCKRADKILTADIIDVKKGTVSLVDRNMKRVSLEKKGKYSYQQIVKQFEFANASLANRFLVLVLDKMIHKTGPVSKPGGVVRGTRSATLPVDSAVILSDLIRFTFPNPGKQKLTFFILDQEHHVLFSKKITDSLLVIKKQTAPWWKPDAYFWEAAAPGKDGTSETIFFIPADEERARLLSEYNELKRSFAGFPVKIKNQLMDEVLREYRWVVK
jgi:hypothetical protein